MTDEVVENLAVAVFVAVFFALVVAGCMWFASASYSSQWSRSGFQTSWGPLKGCTISTDGGKTFIPDSNYRKVADSRPALHLVCKVVDKMSLALTGDVGRYP